MEGGTLLCNCTAVSSGREQILRRQNLNRDHKIQKSQKKNRRIFSDPAIAAACPHFVVLVVVAGATGFGLLLANAV